MNPIKRGVFSATCGIGDLFQDGTAGSRIPDLALAKRGKLSVILGDTFTLSLSLDMALGRLTSGPKSASIGDQVFRVKTWFHKRNRRATDRTATVTNKFQRRFGIIAETQEGYNTLRNLNMAKTENQTLYDTRSRHFAGVTLV